MKVPLLAEADQEQVRQILNQPFSFLGLGKQMTAYESADHQYVLKFFNPRDRMKEQWFHDYKRLKFFCSLKWFSSAYFNRRKRLLKLFERYALSFRELREETALIYVHLNQKTALNQTVHVVDKDGIHFSIYLDKVPFVLQRKVELTGARLSRLQKNQQGVQEMLKQFQELFVIRASKGITDRLQSVYNNYGFLGNKAIQIDVGRINLSEEVKANPQAEVERIMSNIQKSIKF